MDLDSAISYAQDIANKRRAMSDVIKEVAGSDNVDEESLEKSINGYQDIFEDFVDEYQQLADWLMELKVLREEKTCKVIDPDVLEDINSLILSLIGDFKENDINDVSEYTFLNLCQALFSIRLGKQSLEIDSQGAYLLVSYIVKNSDPFKFSYGCRKLFNVLKFLKVGD